MSSTLPALTPVEKSLFLTQCGRGLDSRSPRPILGDTAADDIIREIGYDYARFRMPASSMRDIALRAKKLDGVVRNFVGRHPNAVVVDLGAGLDTRMIRIGPPSTVEWYDVELPALAGARQQLIPPPANAHTVAADVTDPHWLDQLPADRPAVIVADGLLAFLTRDAFPALLNRLTDHFPSGEIAFNGYTRFHVWALKHYRGTNSIADVVANPGFDDPHEPERWAPRLKLVEEILLTRAPEVADYPLGIRLWTRLAARSVALSRRGTTVLRYRF